MDLSAANRKRFTWQLRQLYFLEQEFSGSEPILSGFDRVCSVYEALGTSEEAHQPAGTRSPCTRGGVARARGTVTVAGVVAPTPNLD